MTQQDPFNPLDKWSLAESIVTRLLDQTPLEMPPSGISGSGIYAIYYAGDFAPYRLIADANANGQFAMPIYVGKATPEGGRKGVDVLRSKTAAGNSLQKRLQEHAISIAAASNLDIRHFWCRFLIIEDIWIPLGETMLLDRYRPLWNVIVDGFGNHNPGKGRGAGRKPKWDVLHPGRPWADRLSSNVTALEIETEIKSNLR
jgi:hypothetical protein